jgi:alpha-tubulin suppressor-like RCC1 family protein
VSSPALFAFPPNWREEITETLGYATSVVQAIDGTEYRQGLRTNPRTVLSYTYTEHGTRAQSTRGIQAALWRNHADVVICPYWPDGQPITLQSGPGFVVPTISGREFEVGGYVAAVKPGGTGAYYEVTNIVVGSTSTAITTNKSDALTFGAGDMLYPAYEAEINGIVPSSRITAGVVEYQVSVELFGRPQKDNGIQTYRNRPLFAHRPNRVDAVPAENIRMLAIIESITGRNFRRDQPGREFVARSHDYVIRNRTELHTLRTYLTAMQGQLHGFWAPNFQSDLAMVADTPPGGDVLTIRRIDYADTYAGLIGRSDIAITLRDGNVLYRTITDSTVLSADTEQVEVSPGFGAGLFASEVSQISWLDKCRLTSDEITITWDTAEVCRVTLPMRGIIESVEEPEPPPPGFEGFVQISCGSNYGMGIRHDGSLWAWGSNTSGRAGLPSSIVTATFPTRVGVDNDWEFLQCGVSHGHAIKKDGTLWSWGSNANGRTGLNTSSGFQYGPEQVGSDANWLKITTLSLHSLALKNDGTIWGWGDNANGKNGTGANRLIPTQIGADSTWMDISAGGEHSLATKSNGTLWGWGDGQYFQNGFTSDISSPSQIGSESDWATVSAGFFHSLSIKQIGSLWAWGLNNNGRTGLGSSSGQSATPSVVASGSTWSTVRAGVDYSLGIQTSGSMWGWGSNTNGRNGTGANRLIPTQIGSESDWVYIAAQNHSQAIRTNGIGYGWGGATSTDNGTGASQSFPVELIDVWTAP